jgi:hypothetical protein
VAPLIPPLTDAPPSAGVRSGLGSPRTGLREAAVRRLRALRRVEYDRLDIPPHRTPVVVCRGQVVCRTGFEHLAWSGGSVARQMPRSRVFGRLRPCYTP